MRLNSDQAADVGVILSAPGELWQSVIAALQKIDRPSRPEHLRSEIVTSVPGSAKLADAVLRFGFSLIGFMFALRSDSQSVVRRLCTDDNAQLIGRPLDQSATERLHQLITMPILIGTAKALDLAYDYCNVLRRARVLTDIRPIFTDDAKQIRGAVVGHTLRLRFDDAGEEHALSIAMDDTDLRQLKEECERALLKAQTARTSLEQTKVALFIPDAE